jgi:CHAD domain-containing protein
MRPTESQPLMQARTAIALSPRVVVAALLQSSIPVASPGVLALPDPAQALSVRPGCSARSYRKPLSAFASSAVGPMLADALESRWQTYRKQLRHCQEEFSAEGVHELRVASRRLLAQFVLLDCVTAGSPPEKARRVLKRRLTALSDLRDTHVQILFIDHKITAYPELAVLRAWVQRHERRLVESAANYVRRCKTRKLEKWVSAIAKELTANAHRSRTQERLALAVLRTTARSFAEAVQRRQAVDLKDLRTVHQTRIAFKRFRYMVESLSPALTGLRKRQLRALAYFQRKMGIIQDLEVMQRCVARFLQEHGKAEPALRPFSRHLRQRKSRAAQSFLKTADRLFNFWPPTKLASSAKHTSTPSAA